MIRAERIGAVVVLLLGLGYLWQAFLLENIDIGDPLGPRAFPILLGLFMTVLGFSLVVKPVASADARFFTRASANIPILAAMLLAYSHLIGLIGYPVATFFFLLFAARLLGETFRPVAFLIALVFSAAVFLLFTRVLDIPLPLWGRILG